MRRTLYTVVVLGLLAALPLAAACGGDDDDAGNGSDPTSTLESSASNSGGGDGVWRGTFDTGTEVELELFVEPSDSPLADFEEYREMLEYGNVYYGRVTAKNVTSTPDTGRFVTLTGANGDQFSDDAIILDFLCARIFRWMPDGGATNEAFAKYEELYEGPCDLATIAGPPIESGETVTYYVIFEGDTEPEFERVFMGLGQELEQ